MGLDVRKCKVCGEFYNFTGKVMCVKCLESIEDSFRVIRDYLEQHPNAHVKSIEEDTGIDEIIIQHLLKDGRLEYKNENSGLRCELCGTAISMGRVCGGCSKKLQSSLRQGSDQISKEQEAKRKALEELSKAGGMFIKYDKDK